MRQWFARQAVGGQVDQRAAAQVRGQRHAAGVGEVRQLGLVDRGGEALQCVVAGVHLHQQCGARGDGLRVITRMGAVGGAHLDQTRAGTGQVVFQVDGPAHQLQQLRQCGIGQQ